MRFLHINSIADTSSKEGKIRSGFSSLATKTSKIAKRAFRSLTFLPLAATLALGSANLTGTALFIASTSMNVRPAFAQSTEVLRRVVQLNVDGMVQYGYFNMAGARTALEEALQLCNENNIRGIALARTHLNLGVIVSVGFNENDAALEHFKAAVQADPTIQLDDPQQLSPSVSTPELEALLRLARTSPAPSNPSQASGEELPSFPNQPQPQEGIRPQPPTPLPNEPITSTNNHQPTNAWQHWQHNTAANYQGLGLRVATNIGFNLWSAGLDLASKGLGEDRKIRIYVAALATYLKTNIGSYEWTASALDLIGGLRYYFEPTGGMNIGAGIQWEKVWVDWRFDSGMFATSGSSRTSAFGLNLTAGYDKNVIAEIWYAYFPQQQVTVETDSGSERATLPHLSGLGIVVGYRFNDF